MCDERVGNGPPKGGAWGNEDAMKTNKYVSTRGECVTNAMETAHQKVESGKTKLQQKQAIVLARGANL